MPSTLPSPSTTLAFRPPTDLRTDSNLLPTSLTHLTNTPSNLRLAITSAFSLPTTDTWTYHATAAVTLPQVQSAIEAGDVNGLHSWYVNSDGKFLDTISDHNTGAGTARPTTADIDAYLSLFDPTKDPAKTLKGFLANAKKGTVRASVASYLSSKRFVSSASSSSLPLSWPKWKRDKKGEFWNPYQDFLAWACRELEWCGPTAETWRVGGKSHHVLPVLMHHFGCVCPSFEALGMVAAAAAGVEVRGSGARESNGGKGRKGTGSARGRVLDVGCGNGYWTYMLRQEPFGCEVVPVDNGQSSWRSVWVGDVLDVDAVEWLKKREVALQRDEVLLLVYPVTAGEFTASVIREFRGNVVCVVGTQNGSGYTGFKGEMVDQWFEREMKGWELVARVPVMSFPGKDDALFVFKRKVEGEGPA
jgi:hypothetical protein